MRTVDCSVGLARYRVHAGTALSPANTVLTRAIAGVGAQQAAQREQPRDVAERNEPVSFTRHRFILPDSRSVRAWLPSRPDQIYPSLSRSEPTSLTTACCAQTRTDTKRRDHSHRLPSAVLNEIPRHRPRTANGRPDDLVAFIVQNFRRIGDTAPPRFLLLWRRHGDTHSPYTVVCRDCFPCDRIHTRAVVVRPRRRRCV